MTEFAERRDGGGAVGSRECGLGPGFLCGNGSSGARQQSKQRAAYSILGLASPRLGAEARSTPHRSVSLAEEKMMDVIASPEAVPPPGFQTRRLKKQCENVVTSGHADSIAAVHDFQSDNVMVCLTDPYFNIQFLNPVFERVSGYSKDECLGRKCGFLQRPGDPRNIEANKAIREAINSRVRVDTLMLGMNPPCLCY